MDWNCSRGFLGDAELNKVFRFEEKTTTVVRVVPGTRTPLVSTLGGQKEWDDWFSTDYPRIDGSSSGLVLILARRTGELEYPGVKKVTSNDWLQTIRLSRNKERDALQGGEISNSPASNANTNGQRGLRTLPFSQELFKKLIKKFYVPRSISRAISRADVPTISAAKIDMGNDDEPSFPAFVYNCRTSNAWGNDLALTATYFPHCNMTFAILFGCPISVEEQMLTRLNLATSEAIHPLLIPGIFTELERVRHIEVVETTVNELETRILELDPKSMGDEIMSAADKAERDQAKRNAWLDTTYLRNQLISWNTHLEKLRHHVEDLNQTVFSPPSQIKVHTSDVTESTKASSPDPEDRVPRSSGHEEMSQFDEKSTLDASSETSTAEDYQQHEPPMEILNTESVGMMRQIGNKIQDRVQDIIGEYEEMIRDCTMRVDGMSMATQWAQGETSMEIALATSRDSQHMRSIALVTMTFLPGTFCASIFSTGFFEWTGPKGDAVVSSYFWIFVVMTLVSTLLTLGCWWFFGVYRGHRRAQLDVLQSFSLCLENVRS